MSNVFNPSVTDFVNKGGINMATTVCADVYVGYQVMHYWLQSVFI